MYLYMFFSLGLCEPVDVALGETTSWTSDKMIGGVKGTKPLDETELTDKGKNLVDLKTIKSNL